MDRSREGEDLVTQFISDIGALVRRGARAQLTAALATLDAAPAIRPSGDTQDATPNRRRRRAPVRGDGMPPPGASKHAMPAAAHDPQDPPPLHERHGGRRPRAVPASGDGAAPDPASGGAADRQPVSDAQPGVVLNAREANVLDVVRQLVRATAAEIGPRSGLPNGTVYVILRTLLAKGRIAKTEAARGIEYSLVSSGGVRPFKRVKTDSSPAKQDSIPTDRVTPAAIAS